MNMTANKGHPSAHKASQSMLHYDTMIHNHLKDKSHAYSLPSSIKQPVRSVESTRDMTKVSQ